MAQLPPRTPQEEDERYNPANELYHREFDAGSSKPFGADAGDKTGGDPYAEAGIDQAEAYANDPGNAIGAREDSAGADNPANPMNYQKDAKKVAEKFTGKSGGEAGSISKVRKFTPIGLTLFLIIAGALVTTASLPGLILQHVEETITNSLDDSKPAAQIRTTLVYKMKLDAIKRGFAESSDGKCNAKCKLSTINEKSKGRMEAEFGKDNVDFEKKAGGRYVIKSLKFPDGTTVTNGDDFTRAMKDPVKISAFNRVFNSSVQRFIANKFSGMLSKRFPGLSKKSTLTSDDDKTNREQLARDLGLDDADLNEDGSPKASEGTDDEKLVKGAKGISDAITTGADKFSAGSGKITNVLAIGCAAYDVGKVTQLAYANRKMLIAASEFIIIANTASSARVGNLTPSAATLIGNMLTSVDNQKTVDGQTNPFFGKSFTDSAAYKASSEGDNIALTDQDRRYGRAPSGVTGAIAGLTGIINSNKATGPVALASTHTVCQAVNSPAAILAACAPEIAAGTVAPGVGNAVAAIGCGLFQLAAGAVAGEVLKAVLPGIVKAVVTNDIGAIGSNLAGPAAATLARVGGGGVLGSGLSSNYGLMPGNAQEVKSYKTDTTAVRQEMIAADQYDARNTPFDASNQYSFLGSAIRSLGLLDMNYSSLSGGASWLASVVPNARMAVIPSSFAATDLEQRQADLYSDQCSDPALVDIGVACDGFGVPSFVMSSSEMNADPADVIDKMVGMGAIDADTGEPVDGGNTNAEDYGKYIQYCEDRQNDYGQMSGSIGDDDYGWDSGYLCTCTEKKVDGVSCTTELAAKLHVFRTYAMDASLGEIDDDDPLPGQTDGDGTTEGSTTAVDASSIPNTCSNQTQTGAGISLFSSLNGGSFSDKVNSAPNGNLVSFAAGTFSFSNFKDKGGVVGADISQPGLLGAGVGNTVITMAANSSTKKGAVPTRDWTTNPLYLMRVSKDNTKLDCFTLKGSDQGHLYNGLRIDHASNVQLSNLQLDGASVGDHNFPPGETFAINDWGGNNNVYKNIELNGENKGAAAFGTNSTTGGIWINSSAHDFKYSHGWAMWQQKGGATLENCISVNNWNGVNLERVSGTVTLKNMTFGGNHTDIAGGDDQNDNLKLVIIDPILKGHSKITIGWWPKEMGKPNKWGKDNVKVIVGGVDKTSSMIDWKATGAK